MQEKIFRALKVICGGEFMENVKIFKVRGEYLMSEYAGFKDATNIALESAGKNLDTEVSNFLRENFNKYFQDFCKVLEKK